MNFQSAQRRSPVPAWVSVYSEVNKLMQKADEVLVMSNRWIDGR